jgi:hypothetical protein
MPFQVLRPGGSLITDIAFVGLLTAVNQHVLLATVD